MSSVVPLKEAVSKKEFGGKAANLSRLISAGLPVPWGLAIGLRAFEGKRLTSAATKKIVSLIDTKKDYAVRSSATNEDAADASWAGQFETFLGVRGEDVVRMIEKCHESTKVRAKAYGKKMGGKDQKIAVVVQEMIAPDYAGVLFTRNPVSGAEGFVVEYIRGIGENLVSGRVDPERIVVGETFTDKVPFDLKQLIELAKKAEKTFGVPQDIEFASEKKTVWLLQSRPITTTADAADRFNLGEPADLFYWGPSRAEPLYMSDFMIATGNIFSEQYKDSQWPNPPKTVALFHEHQNVWLINSSEFNAYAAKSFEAYMRLRNVSADVAEWNSFCGKVESVKGAREIFDTIASAWEKTIYAEFSLYGAEIVIGTMLTRLSKDERHAVWQEFTLPDRSTFLQRIDAEILSGENPERLTKKYPWVQDGYFGVTGKALEYFKKRRLEINEKTLLKVGSLARRKELADKLVLSEKEIRALDLARDLAMFMDDRKAWMMRTRSLLKKIEKNFGPSNGWVYDNGTTREFNKNTVERLWKRYIDYKAMHGDLVGIVASKGGEDIVEGEVVVIDSPNTNVKDYKILVVPSTSPSYVPLMRNARALITNHGGMMSHAAIVAREFGLPCIVGTKTATKQLRSGDRVAMDLVSGSIQLIH